MSAMQIRDAYPIVVTERLAECRDFYTDLFGFGPLFETRWFVYLVHESTATARIALMAGGLDFQLPQHREAYRGDSLILTFEVADAAAELERLERAGASIAVELRDEPWGQRHFMLRDPAGVWVDVVEQTEPQPGFLDQSERAALEALAGDA
jgi:uncharacterized glyoxalase superfamily protein PhnB